MASPPRFLGRSRAFARYLKTKNFHVIAERVRKIGGTTLRSIGQISQLQSDASFVPAHNMLRELMNDNKAVAAAMRECHELADKHGDVATARFLENFIDEAERRTWFLFEASRNAQKSGD